jgi:hypothetical protein
VVVAAVGRLGGGAGWHRGEWLHVLDLRDVRCGLRARHRGCLWRSRRLRRWCDRARACELCLGGRL